MKTEPISTSLQMTFSDKRRSSISGIKHGLADTLALHTAVAVNSLQSPTLEYVSRADVAELSE
jgi:hypothetical protein